MFRKNNSNKNTSSAKKHGSWDTSWTEGHIVERKQYLPPLPPLTLINHQLSEIYAAQTCNPTQLSQQIIAVRSLLEKWMHCCNIMIIWWRTYCNPYFLILFSNKWLMSFLGLKCRYLNRTPKFYRVFCWRYRLQLQQKLYTNFTGLGGWQICQLTLNISL